MPTAHYTAQPLSRQIAEHLAERIHTGELTPGDKLPTMAQLRTTWDTTQETVRTALNLLRGQGLVIGQAGRGTYVTDWQPVIRELATTSDAEVTIHVDTPSADAAAALGISTADRVVITTSTEADDHGRVLTYTVTTYRSVTDPLEVQQRTTLAAAPELLAARMPTRSESTAMGLPAGTPVLARERTAITEDGAPAWHVLTLHHGPMTRVRIPAY